MGVSVNLNAAAHNVVNLDSVNATYHGPLKSIQMAADTDNGVIGFAGDLVAGERELRTLVAPNATNINDETLLLIASPEITYYAGQTLSDFYNPSGTAARGIPLKAGDIFQITTGAIVGTIAKDDFVAPVAGSNFLNDVGTTFPTTRFVGKIIETGNTLVGQSCVTIEVVKA